jgi:hypothetical protein
MQTEHILDNNFKSIRIIKQVRKSTLETFKTKIVRRNKEGHHLLIKGTFCQEDLTVVNMYAPNIGVCNFI